MASLTVPTVPIAPAPDKKSNTGLYVAIFFLFLFIALTIGVFVYRATRKVPKSDLQVCSVSTSSSCPSDKPCRIVNLVKGTGFCLPPCGKDGDCPTNWTCASGVCLQPKPTPVVPPVTA